MSNNKSKSCWFEGDQKGNFSNDGQDTFDPQKGYIGIRLQQGVPLLDRDWNELEDIRRYAEFMLRKHYIGSGTPDDGFEISNVVVKVNGYDFQIGKGRFLVDGFEVVNEPVDENGNPVDFILYTGQDFDPVTVPTGERTDTVYLDVWIKEITSKRTEEDECEHEDVDCDLNNDQDVKIETCIRHKVEWRVRVAKDVPSPDSEGMHYYDDIAKIIWTIDTNGNPVHTIEDLRKTNLSVEYLKDTLDTLGSDVNTHNHSKLVGPDGSPDPALTVDKNGNVGIGTSTPEGKLQIAGGKDVTPAAGGFLILGKISGTNIAIDDNEIMARKNKEAVPLNLQVEGGGLIVHGALDEGKRFVVKGNGDVGIGTTNPSSELHINSNSTTSLTLTGSGTGYTNAEIVLEATNSTNFRGLGIFMHDAGGDTEWYAGKPYKYADQYQIGRASGVTSHSSSTAQYSNAFVTIKNNGNVGIGTINPRRKLDINGDIRMHSKGNTTNVENVLYLHDGGNRYGLTLGYNETVKRYRTRVFMPRGQDFAVSSIPDSTDPTLHSHFTDHLVVRGNGKVGIGTPTPSHKLEVNGDLHVRNWGTVGSDYAEYFESKNGKEIETGTSVVMDRDKIRPAKKGETPFGIISANPGGVSGVHVEWPKKYLKDEFGNQMMEEYKEEIMVPKKEKVKKERQKVKKKKFKEKIKRIEIVQKKGKYCQVEVEETIEREEEEPVFRQVDLYDAFGKKKIGKHQVPVMETYEEEIEVKDENGQPVMVGSGKFETKSRPKINPEYDETKEYIPREKRPEWNCVGLLGQIPLRKGQPVALSWIKIKDISKDVELWLVR